MKKARRVRGIKQNNNNDDVMLSRPYGKRKKVAPKTQMPKMTIIYNTNNNLSNEIIINK